MLESNLTNLISWTGQVFVIAMLGWLLPIVFRVRHPRTQLAYCHAVLALCVILPLAEPWRHPVLHRAPSPDVERRISVAAQPSQSRQPLPDGHGSAGPITTRTEEQAIPGAPDPSPQSSTIRQLPWTQVLFWSLAAGAAARFLWLLTGLWQIRHYRIGSMPLYPIPESVRAASAITHADALFCISPNVTGPVMLGWLTPVVLLPESFLSLDEEAQCGIVCHELLHVRRHDWLVTLFEELAGALFWFNPAVWAVLAQTRLAREELVDSEVVRLTASRDSYVDALLAIARGQSVSDLAPAPAPLFLRRRHLTQRMHSLLKEISMSKFRLLSSYGSIAAMLALATWITVGSFPLIGQPQVVTDAVVEVAPVAANNPAVPQATTKRGQPSVRADARRPAGIAFQSPQVVLQANVRGPSLPTPPDPHELVTGSVQAAVSPSDRAAALAVLQRAAENSRMHIRTMSPYELKATFMSGGNVSHTGAGELTESWLNGQTWRWTASMGGYSIVRIASRGQTVDAQPVTMVPTRIQMLRDAIFWAAQAPGPNAMIRTAAAQWNGKPVTCVLTSRMPPVAGETRLWEEEEHCIDNASGLLQVYSIAPGTSVIYGYARNQQFHGRAVPDQVTTYLNGKLVLEAQISLTDLGSVDPGIFTITPEMTAAGPAIALVTAQRFAQNVGNVSGTARPVIVHATIDGNGVVTEEELCAASDPSVAQLALDLVETTNFGVNGRVQRDAYINVRIGN